MGDQDDPAVSVTVRNLGGIDEREVTFDRGVTVLTGRNATNRTSLLQAIAAGLGGSYGELKSDADDGEVELTIDGETYTRRFDRRDGAVAVTGEPYTDDEELVDLFSCLLAANPARRAVERGDGDALREIIMAPVDTAEIRAEVEDRQRELRRVGDRLDEIERRRSNLPALEEQRRECEDDLEAVEDELADVRAALDEFEDGIDGEDEIDGADGDADSEEPPGREEAAAAETVVEELTETREEYESVRNRIETQRTALESLESEREETSEALDEASPPEAEIEATEAELERLQRRERELANTVTNLESIVEFNEDLLESGDELGDGDDDVVADLDPSSSTVECWTCGTTVERGDVADRLDDLRAVVSEKREERSTLRDDVEECRERLSDLREAAEDVDALEADLAEIDDEIDERRGRIEDLESREADLRERIDELEAEAAESEAVRDSEVLERYRRLSELEYERGQLEEQLAGVSDEIEAVEELAEERDRLEAERDDLREELASLRDRIDELETTAIETFNDHMATIIDRLGYENVERVWIERRTDGDRDGPVPESTFVLHVVRSGDDGAVYEDTVDHLSESEREVIGLVVALAGYLVHDVHEAVPIVTLDSLEAIDADRIAALVEYFADYAPVLIAALLPEDAQAVDDRHDRRPMDEAVA